MTDGVVEDGTVTEVDCGGTLKCENCWATDGFCCQDWLCDWIRLGQVRWEPWDFGG